MARATRRPMRPKPLIATFTAMSKNPFCGRGPSVLLAEPCQDLGGDSIGGQAEMLVQIVDGRRCAETVDAETKAIAARRDRKSVVEGKSVSVRVDIGGRRNIKKKNKNTKIGK